MRRLGQTAGLAIGQKALLPCLDDSPRQRGEDMAQRMARSARRSRSALKSVAFRSAGGEEEKGAVGEEEECGRLGYGERAHTVKG